MTCSPPQPITDLTVRNAIDTALANPSPQTYSAAYGEIANYLASLTDEAGNPLYPADDPLFYWFNGASQINSPDTCASERTYAQHITENALDYEGMEGDVQEISNAIAQSVLSEIKRLNYNIPCIEDIITQEVLDTLSSFGLTVGDWPGSLYYFNTFITHPVTGIETTIGDYIIDTPGEYEKFVALQAEAAVATAVSEAMQGLLINPALVELEDFLAGMEGSQAPNAIQNDIFARAAGLVSNNFGTVP